MTLRPTPWMRKYWQLLWLAAAAGLAGCPASAEQVAPPQYNFYFPTGLALSPDERYLFVVSANSDLRYSSGALHVLDLDQVDQIANTWRDSPDSKNRAHPDGCEPIATRPTVLTCPTSNDDGTPASGLVANAAIQIGSFGVSLGIEPLVAADGSASSVSRVFVTVRGDPSITWADFDSQNPQLTCGGTTAFPRCDEPHRLARMLNDATLPSLSSEPFGIAVDTANQHAFVTHLTTGEVTLIAAPNTVGSSPVLANSFANLFSFSFIDGTIGAVGVAPRLPGDPRGLIYVTSRSEARVGIIHAIDSGTDAAGRPIESLARTDSFFFDGLATAGDSGDSRNLVFNADGSRAYLISRTPPSLRAFDTSLDDAGAPKNNPLGSLELCAQPANLALADFGEGPRAIFPCFATGQVWITDPETLQVVSIEDAGRGPVGVAVSARRKKIYIGNYAEDTLIIIDATPGSIWQHRAVLRIGTPRIVGN